MIEKLTEFKLFINEPNSFSIRSGVLNKNCNGVILIYDSEYNDYEINIDDNKDKLMSNLKDCLNSDPDGGLLWIPKKYSNDFISFIKEYILEKDKEEEINYSNGSVGEAFGFHYHEKGMLVEMIDPECFTEIFKEAIKRFCEFKNIEEDTSEDMNLDKIFYYETCHLNSHFNHEKENNYEKGEKRIFELIKLFK